MAGNGVRSDLVTRSVAPALSPAPTVSNGSLDLQLHVNASSGDVTLSDANQTSAVSFVSYTILVNDKSINTLLVGNPADKSKGTGPTGVAPRTKSPPFTGEKLLAETNTSNASYNSSAAAIENSNGNGVSPSAWTTALDGFNGAQSAFGLIENFSSAGVTATITIPVNGSVDLGNIFNTLASQSDLTFEWEPATASGANQSTTLYSSGTIDYIGGSSTPEPGTLGILGVGGVMMMRRGRRR